MVDGIVLQGGSSSHQLYLGDAQVEVLPHLPHTPQSFPLN